MRTIPTTTAGSKKKTAILCVLVLTALALVVVVALSANNLSKSGEFIPPEHDAAAVSGIPNPEASLQYQRVEVQGKFAFSLCYTLYCQQDGSVIAYFTNPENSEMWMLIEFTDSEGKTLYKSGYLMSGEYVERLMPLLPAKSEAQEISINIYGYEPETFYSMGQATLPAILQPY